MKFITEIKNIHFKNPVSSSAIKELVAAVLKAEKIKIAQLTIVFVTDPYIKQLNKKFLFKDFPTDVLSFDLKLKPHHNNELAGDVVVSLDTARIQSQALNISFKEELYRYVVHGILHLIGYDDADGKQRTKMWKRQEFLLKKIMGFKVSSKM